MAPGARGSGVTRRRGGHAGPLGFIASRGALSGDLPARVRRLPRAAVDYDARQGRWERSARECLRRRRLPCPLTAPPERIASRVSPWRWSALLQSVASRRLATRRRFEKSFVHVSQIGQAEGGDQWTRGRAAP